ncbi:M20/M25/M40 family metallo-hydrolase, partial [Butyricicoccus sp. 1XD8-22]
LGYSSFTMYSGASHDAKSMSNICPSGMIFIPSVNGISHHPDEFSKWTDIEKGSFVLKNVVQKLSLMKEDVLYEYGNA